MPWYACLAIPAVGGGLAGLMNSFAARLKGTDKLSALFSRSGGSVGDVIEAVMLGNGQCGTGIVQLVACKKSQLCPYVSVEGTL